MKKQKQQKNVNIKYLDLTAVEVVTEIKRLADLIFYHNQQQNITEIKDLIIEY